MRITSIVALCLTGLIGASYFTSTLKAAEPEIASQKNAVPNSSAKEAPVIQFETNFFDFGKLIAPGSVSGAFKFKNAGNAVLKIDPPVPSCGCTDAKVMPTNTLAPGESGEITYTINLDHAMGQVQKHISVYSTDLKHPEVTLTIQMDYTPLYELSPNLLRLHLPADKAETQATFTIARNDGKPLGIDRLTTSQKWISAAWDSSYNAEADSAKVNVTFHRPTKPTPMIIAKVMLWAHNQTDHPMQTLMMSCEMEGELSATPPQMYWVIPDFGNSITNYPADSLTRTVKLKSVLNEPVKIKSATADIKGLNVQVVPKDAGKTFDLILKFNQLPQEFTSGKITVETSSTSLPKLEVPVIVSVAPK